MMHINLLPRKTSKKQSGAKTELYLVLGIVVAVAAGVYGWHMVLEGRQDEQQQRIKRLVAEMAKLNKDAERVKQFETATAKLQQKIDIIEKLKKQKVGPAKMLDDVTTILTTEKKVWLTKIEEKNGALVFEGQAVEHSNVSDFQLALKRRSKFFKTVRLDFVRSTKKGGKGESSGGLLEWMITTEADYSAG